MPFYIYQNIPNTRVVIHRGQCPFCNNGQGLQENILGDINGQWYPNNDGYMTYQDAVNVAETLAENLNTNFQNCQRCNPQLDL